MRELDGYSPLWSPPLLVINLARRQDRLNTFDAAAARANWFPSRCRIPAVDGAALPASMSPQLISDGRYAAAVHRTRQHISTPKGVNLTMGSVGLYFSHALAWRHIVDRGLTAALIAEDDIVHYSPDFMAHLRRLPPPNDCWDYIQLQSCHRGKRDLEGVGSSVNTKSRLLNASACCMGLYVMSNSGARRALQAVFPIRKEGQLDGRRESLRSKCRGFRFDPPIAQQAGDLQDSDAQIFPRRTLAAVGSTQYTRTHKVQDCPGLPANTTNPDYLSSKLVRQPHMAPPGVATPKRLGAWRFTPSSWKRGRGKSREHT
uniref:Glycosyl transferase family 25 domain-containing protein n=1 Tax=Haptolina ericina TaxID=156174 RepID=A0A7S3BFQ3_9EUKA|mmetsp:Transcript_56752/g.126751  ORF Transcript_56752/g.126751 Transcript_56752/m.126751 type:complete len:316 (+) Transcript_56752:84-1031(+)